MTAPTVDVPDVELEHGEPVSARGQVLPLRPGKTPLLGGQTMSQIVLEAAGALMDQRHHWASRAVLASAGQRTYPMAAQLWDADHREYARLIRLAELLISVRPDAPPPP